MPARPFDDQAACDAYRAWMADRAEGESPHFADRWRIARTDPKQDCYVGWMTMAGLEQARRGLPAPACDMVVVDGVVASLSKRLDKNWTLMPILWWLRRYGEAFTAGQLRAMHDTCVSAKFWISDPGEDHECYFTENHQIIFHVDEFIIGGMWPDEIFPITGRSGAWHRARARAAIGRWLDWRATAGFSEFKSLGYSDVILTILLTLREFADDAALSARAEALIDTVLTGYALHTFRGDLACPQGRSAAEVSIRGDEWMASAVGSLLWGIGDHRWAISAAAMCLACGSYRVPAAIQAIARDQAATREHRERESLDPSEGCEHGIDPADDGAVMYWWGSQQFCHPLVIAASARLMPWPGYYMNPRVVAWQEQHRLDREAGRPAEVMPDHTALGRAEQYAFRTADYKLASVLDYHPGQRGHDQHPWQATLGGKAVVFSQQPLNGVPFERPGYWKGNAVLPRVAQHRQVLIAVHRVHPEQTHWLNSHLYFPKWLFDEVVEDGGWLCGRRGDGYIAVRSLRPAQWGRADPRVVQQIHRFDEAARERALASAYDWTAEGHANAFICELGRRADNGDFSAFVRAVLASRVEGDWRALRYASPALGEVRFGWTGPLTVAGADIPLRSDWRLDSPYGRVRFADRRWDLRAGGHRLELDLADGSRRESEV